MGKSSNDPNKLTIDKNKLCDEDFDKLVIETSLRISARGFGDDFFGASISSSKNSPIADCHSFSRLSETFNRLNQPKRPMNAFMVWGQAIRRELHNRFSNVQNALLSKALGRVWRSLNITEKEPFVRRANLIKANHKRDYPNYKYQPRRVQDRRGKSNLLIGIHLNHPVNQNQIQTNFAGEIYQPYQVSEEQHQQVYNRQKITETKLDQYGVSPKNSFNNVQTFEYHPYPTSESGTIDQRDFDGRYHRTRFVVDSQNSSHQLPGHHHQQLTVSYPTYQHIANDNINYQTSQQDPPIANEIMQSSYLNNSNLSITNNALYYGSK